MHRHDNIRWKIELSHLGALSEIERSIIRDRTNAGLVAIRERGTGRGKPKSFIEDDLAMATVMLKDPNLTTKDIAAGLNISVASLYRYLPAARATVTGEEPAE